MSETEKTHHKGEVIYPNLLLSAAAEHVAAFTLWPMAADHTRIACEFLFHESEVRKPDFDPGDVVDFWDVVNRQDWRICEGVQLGMRSRGFRGGFYAPMEDPSLDIRRYLARHLGEMPGFPGTDPLERSATTSSSSAAVQRHAAFDRAVGTCSRVERRMSSRLWVTEESDYKKERGARAPPTLHGGMRGPRSSVTRLDSTVFLIAAEPTGRRDAVRRGACRGGANSADARLLRIPPEDCARSRDGKPLAGLTATRAALHEAHRTLREGLADFARCETRAAPSRPARPRDPDLVASRRDLENSRRSLDSPHRKSLILANSLYSSTAAL